MHEQTGNSVASLATYSLYALGCVMLSLEGKLAEKHGSCYCSLLIDLSFDYCITLYVLVVESDFVFIVLATLQGPHYAQHRWSRDLL